MQEQQRRRNSEAEEVTPLTMSKVWGLLKTDTVYQYATTQNIMKIRHGPVRRGCIGNKTSEYEQGYDSFRQPANDTNCDLTK
jgi:hypothetical protein